MVDDQDVEVKDVPVLEGFTTKTKEELDSLRQTLGLAMSQADIEHVQRYFEKEEKRDCTMTELRVLDTYWSDHCRHTTFETVLDDVHSIWIHYPMNYRLLMINIKITSRSSWKS